MNKCKAMAALCRYHPTYRLLLQSRALLENTPLTLTYVETTMKDPKVTYSQKRYSGSNMRVNSNIIIGFPDRKMGREKELTAVEMSTKERVAYSLNVLAKGIPKWMREWQARVNFDKDLYFRHKDYQYFADFSKKDVVKKWTCTADSDVDEGFSRADLSISPAGKALFHGFLNTDVPKDGAQKRAGFCNISSPLKYKSFERQIPYDFTGYTDLCLCVRGDGRNYMIMLQMDHYWSHHHYDTFIFPLYTRGGPYWQYVKIPFSYFALASAGRLQERQKAFQTDCIRDVGITLADGIKGPFQLEIAYIGVMCDHTATPNSSEYELYAKDRFLV